MSNRQVYWICYLGKHLTLAAGIFLVVDQSRLGDWIPGITFVLGVVYSGCSVVVGKAEKMGFKG